jgi:hypothetical protein
MGDNPTVKQVDDIVGKQYVKVRPAQKFASLKRSQ